jgi:hypothetical protein
MDDILFRLARWERVTALEAGFSLTEDAPVACSSRLPELRNEGRERATIVLSVVLSACSEEFNPQFVLVASRTAEG